MPSKQHRARVWKLEKGNMTTAARVVAEKALGRPLPPGCEVHHVDGNPSNDDPWNLVLCPSTAYHWLLHIRERALDACGVPDWRPCVKCGCYDDTGCMTVHRKRPTNNLYRHLKGQCRASQD